MPDQVNPLSKREQEILELVARGLTNQEIARDLVISLNTVKVHLRNIFAKLEAASRTEALVKAAQAGWIAVSGLEEDAPEAAAVPPPLPAEPGLARWQRVYFFLAAATVLLALLLPGLWTRAQSQPTAYDLSDAAREQVGAGARVEASRWTSLAPLPQGSSRLALAALDKQLVAVGGEDVQGVTGATYVYDMEANGWLPGAAKPTPVSNVQAGVVKQWVYVPGGSGSDGLPVAALEVYDPATDRWSSKASLPVPLAGYGLAVFDDQVYLFGGWDGTRYTDGVWVYDPAADSWSSLPPMPNNVGFVGVATLADRVLVAGGYDGQRVYSTCNAYYPALARWETCAAMSQPRAGLGMVADGVSVYAIGGGWQQPVTFNERYDSLTNTWSSIPSPLPGAWVAPGVASNGSLVYAVGGWNGAYLDNTEAFQGTFRAFIPLTTRDQ